MTENLYETAARHRALYESLRAKLRALYDRDQFEIHDKVLAFHNELKRRYPNPRQYRLFHLISGSTLNDMYGLLDLPKPDSVEDFIDAEYAKAFPDGEPTSTVP